MSLRGNGSGDRGNTENNSLRDKALPEFMGVEGATEAHARQVLNGDKVAGLNPVTVRELEGVIQDNRPQARKLIFGE